MKKCKKCKTDIDNKATKCPHCQSDQRNWFRRHPVWTFFILCLVVPPFLSSFFSSQKNINERLEISRQPTPNEEQIKQNLTEQKEWEQSKAGKICKEHINWTKEDCTGLANKQIWIGMSYKMLIYQYGKPNSANPSNYGTGTKWQWCWHDYKPSCFYDNNEDGIIDSYN